LAFPACPILFHALGNLQTFFGAHAFSSVPSSGYRLGVPQTIHTFQGGDSGVKLLFFLVKLRNGFVKIHATMLSWLTRHLFRTSLTRLRLKFPRVDPQPHNFFDSRVQRATHFRTVNQNGVRSHTNGEWIFGHSACIVARDG
jgi:hypothetical protein